MPDSKEKLKLLSLQGRRRRRVDPPVGQDGALYRQGQEARHLEPGMYGIIPPSTYTSSQGRKQLSVQAYKRSYLHSWLVYKGCKENGD